MTKIGIVGGGVLGLTLAYQLSRRGAEVIVFEARDRVGGLLDYQLVDGVPIDKYYHCIMGGDRDLLALIEELGLNDRLRFTATRQGVYRSGRLHPMDSGKDFLLFPPLTLTERFRLGLSILRALQTNDWQCLEEVSVEDWLVGTGGRGNFEKLWKPLLRAKFDGEYHRIPATYIWSRMKRTSSPRAAAGQMARMAYLVGTQRTLLERLVERIEGAGSSVWVKSRVDRLTVADGRVTGLAVDGQQLQLDAVVATVPLPVLRSLVPEGHQEVLDLPADTEYLGIVCGLLLLDRSLTPYYTLNIADEGIPFTGIIETTNLIAPEDVGGHHLVYLPKYIRRDSPYGGLEDAQLENVYLSHLRGMFPGFRDEWVKGVFVHRETFVEPLHLIGAPSPAVPVETALAGLYVVNNAQIYPELTNSQSVVRHAFGVVPTILDGISRKGASAPSDPVATAATSTGA